MAEKDWREADWSENYKKYGWFFRLLRGAVLIGIGAFIGMIIYAEPQVRADYVMNLFVTVLGLGATALIFDELNRLRSVRDYKRQLVDDAASISNEIAKNAVHQLRRKGWLRGENAVLKGANLRRANLQGADLRGENLQEARLEGANLQGAVLRFANLQGTHLGVANLQGTDLEVAELQGADLDGANLHGAHLCRANVQGAHLEVAELQGADLDGANLHGANLNAANLQGAILTDTKFDEKTVLPDGSQWTPETDIRRFTDPEHQVFWRSDFPASPAYRSKREE